MRSRRTVAFGLLAWTLVVSGVSAVAWLAIDRAGRQVLEPASLPRAAVPVAAGPLAAEELGVRETPSASVEKPGDDASTRSAPRRTSDASRAATTPRATSPTAAAPRKSSEPARRTRTVSVTGGKVAVTCDGSRVSLLYATPADGWQVTVSDDGPEKVEVHFAQRAGGEGESELSAQCVDGAAQVHEDDHRGGDD